MVEVVFVNQTFLFPLDIVTCIWFLVVFLGFLLKLLMLVEAEITEYYSEGGPWVIAAAAAAWHNITTARCVKSVKFLQFYTGK